LLGPRKVVAQLFSRHHPSLDGRSRCPRV